MGFLRRVLGRSNEDPLDEQWEAATVSPAQPEVAAPEPRQPNWNKAGLDTNPSVTVAGQVEMVGERYRPRSTADLQAATEDAGEQLIEVKVVGESHRQDALASIAGPKETLGKQLLVGAVLRCEPTNEYDSDAVRAEVMGQLLGYVARDHAAVLSPAIERACGGVLEAKGLIVGGWEDDYSQGKYGLRVWITWGDAARLGVAPGDLNPALRPPRAPWPVAPAPAPGEKRLGPTDAEIAAGRYGSQVTVVCEEHYQPTIVAAMPAGWEPNRSWPVLVELAVVDCNPHSKHLTPCVEVRIAGQRVGFFTPAMTERHREAIAAACADGSRVTATAQASMGVKANPSPFPLRLWRLKVAMAATRPVRR